MWPLYYAIMGDAAVNGGMFVIGNGIGDNESGSGGGSGGSEVDCVCDGSCAGAANIMFGPAQNCYGWNKCDGQFAWLSTKHRCECDVDCTGAGICGSVVEDEDDDKNDMGRVYIGSDGVEDTCAVWSVVDHDNCEGVVCIICVYVLHGMELE